MLSAPVAAQQQQGQMHQIQQQQQHMQMQVEQRQVQNKQQLLLADHAPQDPSGNPAVAHRVQHVPLGSSALQFRDGVQTVVPLSHAAMHQQQQYDDARAASLIAPKNEMQGQQFAYQFPAMQGGAAGFRMINPSMLTPGPGGSILMPQQQHAGGAMMGADNHGVGNKYGNKYAAKYQVRGRGRLGVLGAV